MSAVGAAGMVMHSTGRRLGFPPGGDSRSFTSYEFDQRFNVEAKDNQFTIDLTKARKSP